MLEKLPILLDTGEDFQLLKRNILFLCFLTIALVGLSKISFQPPSEATSGTVFYKLFLLTPFASGFLAFILCYLSVPFVISVGIFGATYQSDASKLLKEISKRKQQISQETYDLEKEYHQLEEKIKKSKPHQNTTEPAIESLKETLQNSQQILDELSVISLEADTLTYKNKKIKYHTNKTTLDCNYPVLLILLTLYLSHNNLLSFILLLFE